ncbi:MAG: HD domain-containing protein [Promethearchaeota archaeon]
MVKIPTKSKIKELYQKYKTPVHIQAHMEAVSRFAGILSRALKKNHHDVNIKIIHSASLLHDIGKIFQLDKQYWHLIADIIPNIKNLHHAEIGKIILEYEGYPEIGRLVRFHVGSIFVARPELFVNLEEKVVLLSDLRILETRVCSLEERMDYIEHRYGLIYGKGRRMLKELERNIFNLANIKPSVLNDLVL